MRPTTKTSPKPSLVMNMNICYLFSYCNSPLIYIIIAMPFLSGCFPVSSLISTNRTVHSVDFGRVSCAELQNFEIPFSFRIDKTGKDVALRNSSECRHVF
jgi:hypothetical protein